MGTTLRGLNPTHHNITKVMMARVQGAYPKINLGLCPILLMTIMQPYGVNRLLMRWSTSNYLVCFTHESQKWRYIGERSRSYLINGGISCFLSRFSQMGCVGCGVVRPVEMMISAPYSVAKRRPPGMEHPTTRKW